MTDETETTAAVAYRYVGNPGDHFAGIPPRDLTDDDLAALTDEQRADVENGAIYEKAGKAAEETSDA